jgi:hypothetical protein
VLHAAHGFLLRVKYQLCGMYGRLPGFDLQGQRDIFMKSVSHFFEPVLPYAVGLVGKIRLIEVNGKCRHLKKLTSKGTLRLVVIILYRLEIANFLRTLSHVGIFNPAL